MTRTPPTLSRIDHACPVEETDFLSHLKRGLLLALREQELLDDLRLRHALEQP